MDRQPATQPARPRRDTGDVRSCPHVFISYAREDADLRDRLAEELARWGINTWSDDQLRAGESFNETIAVALYNSRALVLISSADSLSSDYVNAEVKFAQKLGKTVCEVSIAGNRHPDFTDIQRVDFRYTLDWSDIVAQMAPALKRAIGPREIFLAGHPGSAGEQQFLDWVAEELAGQGLDVWYEHERIEFGDDRERLTIDAIDRAAVILAVISADAAASVRFTEHVQRALGQGSQVLCAVYRSGGETRRDLLDAWAATFAAHLGEDRRADFLMQRFEQLLRLEPAEFVDGARDDKLLAQVAKGLRKRQAEFLPDEKVEREAARVFQEFTTTMRELGLDAAAVLDLPEGRVAEPDAAPVELALVDNPPAETPPPEPSPEPPATVVELAAVREGRMARFCHKCGAGSTPGATFCRACGTRVEIRKEDHHAMRDVQ